MDFIDKNIIVDKKCFEIHNKTWPINNEGKLLILKFNEYII